MDSKATAATKVPDLNHRDGHQQSVPHEDEFDLPPPYEPSSSAGTVAAHTPTGSTVAGTTRAASAVTPPSPIHSRNSSLDGHEGAGLLAGSYPRTENMQAGPPAGGCRRADAAYRAPPPMSMGAHDDDDENNAKWEHLRDTPGCCFSESGGCCGSTRGGCCFSDRGGCCFSDNSGCCFSNHEGCCFSDTGGCFFSTNKAACCSDGPPPRLG